MLQYSRSRWSEPLQTLIVDGSIPPGSIIWTTRMANTPSFSSRFISLSLASSCATIRWNSRLLHGQPQLDQHCVAGGQHFLPNPQPFQLENCFSRFFSRKTSLFQNPWFYNGLTAILWLWPADSADSVEKLQSWEMQPRSQWHLRKEHTVALLMGHRNTHILSYIAHTNSKKCVYIYIYIIYILTWLLFHCS